MSRSIILEIDSKNRINGTSTNFDYQFDKVSIAKVNGFRLNKVIIPFTFYMIEQQTFIVNYNGTPFNILIEAGNYSAISLAQQIELTVNNTVPNPGITIQYNFSTNKFQFNATLPNTFSFDFSAATPTRKNYNVGIALGMVLPSNLNAVEAEAVEFESPYQSYIAATKNIFIKSSSLRLYNTSYFINNLSNVFARIPINVNSHNFILWEVKDTTLYFTDNDTITTLDIQLVDEYDNEINLNGYDWSFELEVYTNIII